MKIHRQRDVGHEAVVWAFMMVAGLNVALDFHVANWEAAFAWLTAMFFAFMFIREHEKRAEVEKP